MATIDAQEPMTHSTFTQASREDLVMFSYTDWPLHSRNIAIQTEIKEIPSSWALI